MYVPPPPEERIDCYAGPYERWLYSKALGQPFAFPAIQVGALTGEALHVVAILEGKIDPCDFRSAGLRFPPLWPPNSCHDVAPCALRGDAENVTISTAPDRALARCLRTLVDRKPTPRIRVNMPVAKASWVADYAPGAPAEKWRKPATTPRAILGVIDDGLPFAHRALLGSDGRTRISHLWMQAARAHGRDRVPLGRELTNGEIDEMRDLYGADERHLYRAAGAIDGSLPEVGRLLERHATHGAHILGLAGGNDPRTSLPELDDSVQIIAVQLPNTIAWDTSGFGKEMYMLSALHYIFVRASEIAQSCELDGELPLVVNFSYGWSAGRHDGQSEMELAIQELLTRRREHQPKSFIVMPTGNSFAEAMHAQFTASDFKDGHENGPARIGWRLPPDDYTSSYLEIWLPENFDPAGWEVRVIPPPGTALSAGHRIPINPDFHSDPDGASGGDPSHFVEMEIGGQNVGQLSADHHRRNRWRVMLAVIPTAESDKGRRLPPGLWRIEIDPCDGARLASRQTLDLWVQRDDEPRLMGTGGRQSRLEGACGIVCGYGSLSAICSADLVTRVAGTVGRTARPAKYSSAGGLRREAEGLTPWGAQPSFAAPSNQSLFLAGLPSIGTVSGSSARLIGTSAAAALASRWMVADAAAGRDPIESLTRLPKCPNDQALLRRRARLGEGLVPSVACPHRVVWG